MAEAGRAGWSEQVLWRRRRCCSTPACLAGRPAQRPGACASVGPGDPEDGARPSSHLPVACSVWSRPPPGHGHRAQSLARKGPPPRRHGARGFLHRRAGSPSPHRPVASTPCRGNCRNGHRWHHSSPPLASPRRDQPHTGSRSGCRPHSLPVSWRPWAGISSWLVASSSSANCACPCPCPQLTQLPPSLHQATTTSTVWHSTSSPAHSRLQTSLLLLVTPPVHAAAMTPHAPGARDDAPSSAAPLLRRRRQPPRQPLMPPGPPAAYRPGQPMGYWAARGTPYQKKYLTHRLGSCCIYLAPPIAIVALVVVLVPVLWAIADHTLSVVQMEIHQANLTSPTNTSFALSISGGVRVSSSPQGGLYRT